MHTTNSRESVYRNQGSTSTARLQSIPGRQSLGGETRNPAKVGAGNTKSTGTCPDHAQANPRQRGGQASSPGLFGLPSATGRARRPETPAQAKAVSAQGQAPQADDQPTRVGGLSFSQRRSVILSRTDVAAVSLDSYERRPVPAGPSMESLIAAQRARTARQGDEDTASEPKATPAMLRAAHAADMREAFPHFLDDEQADFAHRCAGAGYVETMLAIEG